VGIDLHRCRTVVVRMSADGQRLGSMVRVLSTPEALRTAMAAAGLAPKVVIEATYGWYWAVETLQGLGAEVHLAHPMGVKGFSCRRVKNDERDAADLADLLRMGRLPEANIAAEPVRALRELVRYRAKLSRWRSSAKSSIHAVLAKRGVVVPMSDLFGTAGNELLDGLVLEPAYAARVSSLRELLSMFDTEITGFDYLIAQLLAGHRGYRTIQRISGVGPVFAAVFAAVFVAVFVAEIGDVGRFAGAGETGQLGRADPAPPRVGHEDPSRADHQAGLHAGAVGRGGGGATQLGTED
jgi:transposase